MKEWRRNARWTIEKIDGVDYLKNVFSGMYMQKAGKPTTNVGPGTSDNRYSCVLESIATGGDDAKWKIFVGDSPIGFDNVGNLIPNTDDDGAIFYIREVVDTNNDEFEKMCREWYKVHAKQPEMNLPELIVLSDTVDFIITPYGLPNSREAVNQINTVINDINIAEDEDVSKERIRRMYEAISNNVSGTSFYNYKKDFSGINALSQKPLIYNTKAVEWATICVPSAWGRAPGLTRYNCNGMDKNTLKLDEENAIDAGSTEPNKPYIVKIDSSCFGKSYQFICRKVDLASTANPTNGWLVGVYGFGLSEVPEVSTDGQTRYYVPKSDDNYDRYVLAKQRSTGKVGFYLVKTANLPVSEYQCYLEIPKEENAARYSFLFFQEDGDVETGIDNVLDTDVVQDDKQGNKQNGKIYNMAGQRLNRMQKGLNIVNGKIIIK